MADILIRIEKPKNCFLCRFFREVQDYDGTFGCCMAAKKEINLDLDFDGCFFPSLPEGHGDLIERKALNLFPDYKEVRNGIKRTIKEAERDGRAITGVSIDLLKQTLVALDSLRSVRRYFLNAKAIVPADVTDNYVGSKLKEGETDDSKL